MPTTAGASSRDKGTASIEQAVRLAPKARALNALTWTQTDPVGAFARSIGPADPVRESFQPLAGVPIVVKDNIDLANAPTTAGTPALRNHIASDDAPVIRLLKDAGAVVVAKTNLHELALGATSINPTFGTVFNPFDHRYTAGGSSGGSAAAVAIGMVPLAVGTDTSGSCRVPASCCGIVGFRPSLDRYPVDRVVPISFNRDTVGLLARDVGQVIAADRVLAPHRQKSSASRERVRLGVPDKLAQEGVSGSVRHIFQAAIQRLVAAGVEVIGCEIPGVPDRLWPTQVAVIGFDMPRHLATYLLRSGLELDVSTLVARIGDPVVKRRLEAMMADEAEAAVRHAMALATMRGLRRDVVAIMQTQGLDALFYPTLVTAAARISEAESIDIDGEARPTGPTLLRNTLLATLAGMPSVSLPVGFVPDGLPVGALLEGYPGCDADLLALGAKLEPILNEQS